MIPTQPSSPFQIPELGRPPDNLDLFTPRSRMPSYADLFTEVAQLRLQIEALASMNPPRRTERTTNEANVLGNSLFNIPTEANEDQRSGNRSTYQRAKMSFEEFIKNDPILDLKAVMKIEFEKCKMKMGEDSPESERRKWEIICYRVFIGDWSNNKLSKIFNETKLKRGRKSQNKIISDLHLEAHKLCQYIDDWLERIYGSKELTIPNPLQDVLADQENYIYNYDLFIRSSDKLLKEVQMKDLPGSVTSEKRSREIPQEQQRLVGTIDRRNRDYETSRNRNRNEERTSTQTRPNLENDLLRNRVEDFGSSSSEDEDSDSLDDARNARSGSEEEEEKGEEVEPLGEERREDLNFMLNATSASKRGFKYFDDPDADRVNRNTLRNKREYTPLISRGKKLEPINPHGPPNPDASFAMAKDDRETEMERPDKTSIPETPVNKDRDRKENSHEPIDFEKFASSFNFKDLQRQWTQAIGFHEDIIDNPNSDIDKDIWEVDCFQNFIQGWTKGEKMLKILIQSLTGRRWYVHAEGLEEIYTEMMNVESKFEKWLQRKLGNGKSKITAKIQSILKNGEDYTYNYEELNKFERSPPEENKNLNDPKDHGNEHDLPNPSDEIAKAAPNIPKNPPGRIDSGGTKP